MTAYKAWIISVREGASSLGDAPSYVKTRLPRLDGFQRSRRGRLERLLSRGNAMSVKNYYAVLGVEQTDSEDTIRKAYRQLAKKYHPDLNPGDKIAEAKMREIGEAWETLGDEAKRKKYDQELSGSQNKNPFAAGPSTVPKSDRPMTQEEFMNMSRVFDQTLSREAIKNSANQTKPGQSPNDPLNTSAFFEQFMGFKDPKKK